MYRQKVSLYVKMIAKIHEIYKQFTSSGGNHYQTLEKNEKKRLSRFNLMYLYKYNGNVY